ncbi:transaldolase [Halomonas beimenensis]|uniref:Transaldolase n=1 Tax=Halomonas beimenensis TaxID=475662 RepID=A0A291P9Q1_9GAMM|nr:transaldolase [Halomonas beimenensis]ATJ83591.1 transaldolase [Halomonas beimenensis]
MSRLRRIVDFGQQVWLDNLSRRLLESGRLERWLEEDAIAGVTSNPTIFHKAIAEDPLYQDDLARLRDQEPDPERRFEALVLPDIRAACDLLRPRYEATGGDQGYVSFEVSPHLAQDAAGTLAAAERLWAAIDRPNAMIKIPATRACLPAIRDAIAAGLNVNVTLMFSPRHLDDVFTAYRDGLAARHAAGQPVDHIHAVASFFLSRVDTLIDGQLPESAAHLRGRIAVASAKTAYARWREVFGDEAFATLRAAGARPQSCLWASTGTKNPAYSDVLYVEELIGPDTVNTVPDATLAAFADHGEAAETLTAGLDEARERLAELKALGIDLDDVGERLQREGLAAFERAFDELLRLVD